MARQKSVKLAAMASGRRPSQRPRHDEADEGADLGDGEDVLDGGAGAEAAGVDPGEEDDDRRWPPSICVLRPTGPTRKSQLSAETAGTKTPGTWRTRRRRRRWCRSG